ncbi:ABC transporter permease [Paenibacillus antibioticophila]|uniref:ABC transporter permease n=1 Tax=Paenibacillus antibioticophila TaxID=1274374 RepID=A0A919XSL3_9BACL|nr:ABC transporter permease [Paenibacillus antibioticophila]GIO35568.1 ABC transporter permease [Paenibacillus antibioticophila]
MKGQISTETTRNSTNITDMLALSFRKMLQQPVYRLLLWIAGAPFMIILWIAHRIRLVKENRHGVSSLVLQELQDQGVPEQLEQKAREQLARKHAFFQTTIPQEELEKEARSLAQIRLKEILAERTHEDGLAPSADLASTYHRLLGRPEWIVLSVLLGWPLYVLMALFANPYLRYVLERLVMALGVIIGVAFLVFTILYISPMNPAASMLGETATAEQIAAFNQLHGLDQPYFIQLWHSLKGILTFDLGRSFVGNESVTTAMANKFPVTLTLTVISTLLAIIIALPIGIISATRPNSVFDYTFMFIALLGLSIPNFWQGLIFILNFSIKLSWLPATYSPGNWLSALMPIVVLGTGFTASVARMTRSSMLEIIHEDYIMTARAKGLPRNRVLWRHAVTNALIPIVTVIGLLFGGLLGGAAVTEKVFNISGIGSYIVDRQFIPDIPSIMGGVVYTAIAISIVNVIVDLLYAFIDPRIRSKIKQN